MGAFEESVEFSKAHEFLQHNTQRKNYFGRCSANDLLLRSKTPELSQQEFYAFLLSYFAVRGIMHEAAYAADEAPSRLSFINSINVIRRKLPAFGTFPPAALG